MSTPLQDRLESALESFRAQQEKIRAFQERMADRTTTVTSKNRMVVVTVDATGLLTGLEFKGNRYRTLPPAELGALVVETVASAQQEARTAAMQAASELRSGGGLGSIGSGGRDLDSIFRTALDAVNTPIFEEAAGSTGASGKERS
jgi:DNA-binding protein YbaB